MRSPFVGWAHGALAHAFIAVCARTRLRSCVHVYLGTCSLSFTYGWTRGTYAAQYKETILNQFRLMQRSYEQCSRARVQTSVAVREVSAHIAGSHVRGVSECAHSSPSVPLVNRVPMKGNKCIEKWRLPRCWRPSFRNRARKSNAITFFNRSAPPCRATANRGHLTSSLIIGTSIMNCYN